MEPDREGRAALYPLNRSTLQERKMTSKTRTPFAFWPDHGLDVIVGRAKYFRGTGDDRKRRLLRLYAGSEAATFRLFKFRNRDDFRFLSPVEQRRRHAGR